MMLLFGWSCLLFGSVIVAQQTGVDLPLGENKCNSYGYTKKLAEPRDCRIFYQCEHYKMVYKVCPIGLYFSELTQACVAENGDSCNNAWYPTMPVTSESSLAENASPTFEVEGGPVTPTPSISSRCRNRPNGFTYSTPENCRSYAVCWQEESHWGECPKGFSYNSKSSVCDTANNHRCEAAFVCPPSGIHAFQMLGACLEYNFCFAGIHLIKECAHGLQFDAKQKRCALPEVAVCFACPVVDDPLTIVTFNGYLSNEYYICQNGEVVLFKCANNLHWNQRKQHCEITTI